MKRVAVLMAGGKSERLWPYSRASLPKQFLSLTGDGQTMAQLTVRRLLPLIPYEDIFIVTNRDYLPIVRAQLPELPAQNILAEPAPRNTAPCIALAAAALSEKYGDAVMLVLAADHLIRQEDVFLHTLKAAADFAASREALVTMGIRPAYPEAGYGYIHYDPSRAPEGGLYPVRRFVEKPDMELARQYCLSGEYLWNSGMFVWRVSVITEQFRALMPDAYAGLAKMRAALQAGCLEARLPGIFAAMPATSIDYGIMEHAPSIYTIPGLFQWLDVGNWNALPQITPADGEGNLFDGDVIGLDTKNTVVKGADGRLIALIGLDGLAVVDTKDALLISTRDRLADIKKVLEQLRAKGRLDKL